MTEYIYAWIICTSFTFHFKILKDFSDMRLKKNVPRIPDPILWCSSSESCWYKLSPVNHPLETLILETCDLQNVISLMLWFGWCLCPRVQGVGKLTLRVSSWGEVVEADKVILNRKPVGHCGHWPNGVKGFPIGPWLILPRGLFNDLDLWDRLVQQEIKPLLCQASI